MNLVSSSPMASYDSTPKMYCSEVLPTEPELLHLRQLSPQIPYVILEDGTDHLLYCSFEKPCLFCDDKYSIPDPVYCYGVLMGGIRRGKPGTIMPNYKVSCDDQQEHLNNKKLLPREFSCIQEDASHGHQDHLLSSSQEIQSLVYDHKGSSCHQPLVLWKAPGQLLMIINYHSHCLEGPILQDSKITNR